MLNRTGSYRINSCIANYAISEATHNIILTINISLFIQQCMI